MPKKTIIKVYQIFQRLKRAAIHAEVQQLLKQNRYASETKTLIFTVPEAASYRDQIEKWTIYFSQPSLNRGLLVKHIKDSKRASAADRFLCLDRLGLRGESSRQILFLHEQFPLRPNDWQHTDR